MRLDLSVKGKLSIGDSLLIDKIAPKVYDSYNNFIVRLVADNSLCELDLLLSIVSRNPLQSQLLPIISRLILLQEKLERGEVISQITIEDSSMLSPINGILAKFDVKIPIQVKNKNIFFVFQVFLKFIQSAYLIFISWVWPRLTMTYRKKPKESILLVDTFVLPGSFTKKGEFIDRYYTGYNQYLSGEQNRAIWYSPMLVGYKTLMGCIRMANLSKRNKHNFLFQESWLTLFDYIHAMYLTVVLPLKIKNYPLFMGCDIRKILISEVKKDVFSPTLIKAICRFKFIKNMSTAGIDICRAVNWHENQNIDKAFNLGFHVHYPAVSVKGYQGYIAPSYWSHTVPQLFELEARLLPDNLYVISNNRKKDVLSNCPGLEVGVASAFRFSYLSNITRAKPSLNTVPTVLITLPIDIDESKGILHACIELHSLVNRKINVLVKQHPVYSKCEFEKMVPAFKNDTFIVVDDSMSNLLERISLLISSASSTCAEAVSLGIPVAIYGNRYGITANPVSSAESAITKVFYSKEQLVEFIDGSLKRNNQGKDIEKYFFIDNSESAQDLFVCK